MKVLQDALIQAVQGQGKSADAKSTVEGQIQYNISVEGGSSTEGGVVGKIVEDLKTRIASLEKDISQLHADNGNPQPIRVPNAQAQTVLV